MNTYLIPGLLGLLTGLLLHWGMLSRASGLQSALALRRSLPLRTCLTALGWGLMLTALLIWLAVIDTDDVPVLPLSLGTLLGGVLFGLCAGWSGFTPTTAFAGVGGGNAPEALCLIAGCFAGTALSGMADSLFSPLQKPWLEAVLFQFSAAQPRLLSGGLTGLASLGGLLAAWAVCIPSPKPVLLPDEVIAHRAAETDVAPAKEAAPDPQTAASETVVALLEGEEPLVVDTALDEPAAEAEDVKEEDDQSEEDNSD